MYKLAAEALARLIVDAEISSRLTDDQKTALIKLTNKLKENEFIAPTGVMVPCFISFGDGTAEYLESAEELLSRIKDMIEHEGYTPEDISIYMGSKISLDVDYTTTTTIHKIDITY